MTKVLVTGAAGFVGGHIVKELLSRGHTVKGLDNLSKYGQHARAQSDNPRYNFVMGDAGNPELLSELLGDCEHFIANAALIGGVGYMKSRPLDIIIENNRLIGAAAQVGIEQHRIGALQKVTYVSSSMVFEHVAGGNMTEGDELMCRPPSTAYGFQKLSVEYCARAAWEQYRLPYTIVRPFNCVGAGARRPAYLEDHPQKEKLIARGHVIPDFIERAIRRDNPFCILGDGQQIRTFTYVQDIAIGIALAMEKDSAFNEDFNLAGSESCNIEGLASMIWERVNPGEPLNIKHLKSYPHDVRVRRPDATKARQLLGFNPVTPLGAMIDEVIDWVGHHEDSGDAA